MIAAGQQVLKVILVGGIPQTFIRSGVAKLRMTHMDLFADVEDELLKDLSVLLHHTFSRAKNFILIAPRKAQ